MHVVVKLKGQNYSCEVKYIQYWKCRALVKWGICACTEWLVNIIAKHCFWNLFYDMSQVRHSLGPRYWLLRVFNLQNIDSWLPYRFPWISLCLQWSSFSQYTYIQPHAWNPEHWSTRRQSRTSSWSSAPKEATLTYPIRSTDMMHVDDQPSQVARRDWMTGESCQDPLWPLNWI